MAAQAVCHKTVTFLLNFAKGGNAKVPSSVAFDEVRFAARKDWREARSGLDDRQAVRR
jgi:hypothetical protein